MKPITRQGLTPQKPTQPGGAKGTTQVQARPPTTAPATGMKKPHISSGPQTYVVICKEDKEEIGLETLAGDYVEVGTNHGRKYYKRTPRNADDEPVFIYFWDARDGADFSGWWFGESVGGAQVWSRCEKNEAVPPKTGWRVPWNKDVQPNLVVELKREAPAPGVSTPTAPAAAQADAKPAPAAKAKEVIEVAAEGTGAAEAPGPTGVDAKVRVQKATDRIEVNEIEATQALESVRTMMEGEVTEDSLKIVEELLQSQQVTMLEATKKLALDMSAARKDAPATVPAINALVARVRNVQSSILQEMKQVKQLRAKKKHEAEELQQRAKAEEMQMKAEQRDAKSLEEGLPEAMEVVTAAEDLLDAVVTAASPLAHEFAETMNEAVLTAIRETETAVTKAQESIKTARIKITQKIMAAKTFAPEAKKVALTEYQALQDKLDDLQKKLHGYARIRKDQEQKMLAKKVMTEVTSRLGIVEVEVEKVTGLPTSKEPSEEEIKSAEVSLPPVAASLASAMKLVEQRLQSAEGALKADLTQMHERGKESKKKLDAFRAQLHGQLEQLQAKAVLQQGLEKTQAAEEALAKTEEAETPFLKGLELMGAEAMEAIAALKEAGKVADSKVNAAKSFLKAKIVDIKRLPEAAQESAIEELSQLATRVEAAAVKLAAFRRETLARETSTLLREVAQKVTEAEASVKKTLEVSAPLLAEKLEEVEVAKLKEASGKTMEAEKAAALACAEARKVLMTKLKDGQLKDAPGSATELSKLQGRLTNAQQELSKQRKVAVQGEKLWKSKLLIQEKEEQMKQLEKEVEKAEILTMPIGDERPSNESIVEMDTAVSSAQKTLTELVASLQSAQQSAIGSLKDQLTALLARTKTAQEKLDEMKESTRDQRDRVQCESLLQEARGKLAKVDAAFQQAAEAEAPYLKGMEILPTEEATKALADSVAAATAIQQAISEARTFISSKSLELKTLTEAKSKDGLKEMTALMKRNEDATEKLEQFKNETEGRQSVAMQQEAIARVTAAADAVQKVVDAAAPLTPENASEVSQTAAKEIIEKLDAAEKEALDSINKARQFLGERQRDRKVRMEPTELSKLTGRLNAVQVELAKAKTTASEHEQRLVSKMLLQDASSQIQDLESALERANEAAAPLIGESGKRFIVASMTRMLVEALNEHCHKTELSRDALFAQIGVSNAETKAEKAAEGKVAEAEFVAFLERIPELCSRPDLAFSLEQRSAVFEQADADKDGWISKEEFLDLFRERFICVHEISVTDSFEICDSRTLEKLVKDDVVEALTEPKPLDPLGVMRLEVSVLKEGAGNIQGWVTVQGNQGTTYFKPFTAYAAFVKDLDKTLHDALVTAQKASAFVASKSTDLRETKEGPLAEAKTELAKMRPKVNVIRMKLEQLNKKVEEGKREHSKREEFEKRKQEEKKERKAASFILRAISEKVEKAQVALKQLEAAALPLTSAAESDLSSVATPLTVRAATVAAAEGVTAALAESRECLAVHESKVANATKGPWLEAKQEMAKLMQQVEEVEKTAASMSTAVQAACETLAAATLGQASAALRKAIQERGTTAEALYSELAGENQEQIPEAKFSGLLDSLGDLNLLQDQKQLIFQKCLVAGGIGRRGFFELLERYSQCVKEIAITSEFDIKSSTTLRKLEVGEFVEVLEGPRSDDALAILRVRVRALSDGTSGWVSVKGNQGTPFLQDCSRPCYLITKAMIMQDGFSSAGSKELRSLKAGEVIEVIEGPQKEVLGNAVRARAKAVSDGAVGWFTVTTRQGQACARRGQSTFTCKSGIALTNVMNIKDCKVLRKLDKGEVLMVLEGPIEDQAAGVTRIKAKAMKDESEGWVTTRGNAGSIYVEETGRTYVVTTGTSLQATFESDSVEVRALSEGESMELLEGPMEEASEPVVRVNVRAVSDGRVGWVTLVEGSNRPWSPSYRCVAATAIDSQLTGGQRLRDLQTDEALEALEGPKEDSGAGVLRLKCRAATDGAVGWVALSGAHGEAFLECGPAQ